MFRFAYTTENTEDTEVLLILLRALRALRGATVSAGLNSYPFSLFREKGRS